MGTVPPLFTFLLMLVSGWVHRHQLIVIEFLRRADVKERLDVLAMDIQASTTEAATAFIKKQIDTWTAVAKKANVRAD